MLRICGRDPDATPSTFKTRRGSQASPVSSYGMDPMFEASEMCQIHSVGAEEEPSAIKCSVNATENDVP